MAHLPNKYTGQGSCTEAFVHGTHLGETMRRKDPGTQHIEQNPTTGIQRLSALI